jgi:hypothetical protein
MKKFLTILALAATPLFAQQKEQALHLLYQNIDSTYFDAEGNRWLEFSMPILRAYKVMDLIEADTTCTECILVKSNKDYRKYLKLNYPELKATKIDKKVAGHLDAVINGTLVMMWMHDDYAMGMITVLPVRE